MPLSENLKYSCQAEPEKFNRKDRRVGAKAANGWRNVVYDRRTKRRGD